MLTRCNLKGNISKKWRLCAADADGNLAQLGLSLDGSQQRGLMDVRRVKVCVFLLAPCWLHQCLSFFLSFFISFVFLPSCHTLSSSLPLLCFFPLFDPTPLFSFWPPPSFPFLFFSYLVQGPPSPLFLSLSYSPSTSSFLSAFLPQLHPHFHKTTAAQQKHAMSINRGNVVLVIGMLAAGTANTIITKCTLFVLVTRLPLPVRSAPAVLFLFSYRTLVCRSRYESTLVQRTTNPIRA